MGMIWGKNIPQQVPPSNHDEIFEIGNGIPGYSMTKISEPAHAGEVGVTSTTLPVYDHSDELMQEAPAEKSVFSNLIENTKFLDYNDLNGKTLKLVHTEDGDFGLLSGIDEDGNIYVLCSTKNGNPTNF